MCECVWGCEAALLFPGQLLVTQEWLICNGCCHSPAVAPGDGRAVTNAHALTFSLRRHTIEKFKKHTCTHTWTHKFRRAVPRSPGVCPATGDKKIRQDLTSNPVSFYLDLSFTISVFLNSSKCWWLCSCFCLQSTVVVEKSIQDLMSLMQDLSAYSNQFLEMVCDKLKEYKEICNTAYR